MHATLQGSLLADSNRESDDGQPANDAAALLPSKDEYERLLDDYATFDLTDPSYKYDITSKHKLGIGGFAKVFRVMRRADKLACALKFIETKGDKEKIMMRNEVALMNKFKDDQIVLEIFD